jgi:hypothetical protein
MTAVLAIDFIYEIIVIADCRVTWSTSPPTLQDNLQKIYPYGPTGVIAFAGDINNAKTIINYINQETPKKTLPLSAYEIAKNISSWAKLCYDTLPETAKQDVQLMYVASEYAGNQFVASNVTIAKNILCKMASPHFDIILENDAVRLGYAINYPLDLIRSNRDSLLNLGLDPALQHLQAGIAVTAFGDELEKLGEMKVGGLFSVGIINTQGVGFYPYGNEIELIIEDKRFIQYDHTTESKIPLKTIFEFDPTRLDSGNLLFRKRPI